VQPPKADIFALPHWVLYTAFENPMILKVFVSAGRQLSTSSLVSGETGAAHLRLMNTQLQANKIT
jgi:hypothetical protein